MIKHYEVSSRCARNGHMHCHYKFQTYKWCKKNVSFDSKNNRFFLIKIQVTKNHEIV